MAPKDPARKSRPSRKAEKSPLAEDNARLRRTLAREKGRRRQLEEKLSVGDARQEETAAALDAGREQQAATAEILRLISTSPSDAQPVFDAIARNAARLCGGLGAVVLRFDGTLLHLAAFHNVTPESVGRWESRYPEVPGRNTPVGRAALDGAVVHVPDLQTAVEFSAAVARQSGVRGLLAVPLLREGHAIGAIGVSRLTPGPFSDQQIALLQTFAAQAVIAIDHAALRGHRSRPRPFPSAVPADGRRGHGGERARPREHVHGAPAAGGGGAAARAGSGAGWGARPGGGATMSKARRGRPRPAKRATRKAAPKGKGARADQGGTDETTVL
ncbi:MAG TPA: GAF domain-containing protein, partial [Candidatus Limnocylindrales bacterium]|nr:GAF domain-containing protein [Candidatus Limnocylindrales bacterium]